MTVHDPAHRLLARVLRSSTRLYTGKLTIDTPVCLLTRADDEAWKWHARMGHLHFRELHAMSAKGMVRGMPEISRIEQYCDGCALGKQHRAPFPQASTYRAERGLELVHTDLCGPITPATPRGNKYFILVVDDYNRFMWIELIKSKDEAYSQFRKIKSMAEAEGGCKLRAFRSDRGGEFNSTEFKEYCSDQGVKHYTTAPYSPQQNGVVERRNQSVVEMARCLMKSMGVPASFWGEAVKNVVHLLNRAPTRSLKGITPYEAWHGRKPAVQHLRTFGCTAHVKLLGPGIAKLSDRSKPTIFVGYEEGAKCYRVYDPESKKVQVTRDVHFEEGRPWSWGVQTTPTSQAAPVTFFVVYTMQPGVEELDTGGAHCNMPALAVHSTPTPEAPQTEVVATSTPTLQSPGPSTPTLLRSPEIRWATLPTHDDTRYVDSGPIRYPRLSCVFDATEEDAE